MLIHLSWKPRSGLTHDDQKRILELWAKWEAPEGFDIKMHVIAPDGGGFGLVEAKTAEALHEAIAPWAAVLFDYVAVPVVDIDNAIPILESGIARREAG
jgi:hypothetical protein